MNWTLPVGVPVPPKARTVAVKVTGWPKTAEAGAALIVVVDGLRMNSFSVAELLLAKLLLGSVKLTTTVCGVEGVVSVSELVENVATPLTLSVFVARKVPVPSAGPSKKVTLPVAVAIPGAAGVTVAVKVTELPYTELLGDALTATKALSLAMVSTKSLVVAL